MCVISVNYYVINCMIHWLCGAPPHVVLIIYDMKMFAFIANLLGISQFLLMCALRYCLRDASFSGPTHLSMSQAPTI